MVIRPRRYRISPDCESAPAVIVTPVRATPSICERSSWVNGISSESIMSRLIINHLQRRSSSVWKRLQRADCETCVKTTCRYRNTRLRSEEHTSELQSHSDLVCRLL